MSKKEFFFDFIRLEMKFMTKKGKEDRLIFSIAGMIIVLLFLIIPVSAYTLAEVNLVTENRPYDSDNPAKKSKH